MKKITSNHNLESIIHNLGVALLELLEADGRGEEILGWLHTAGLENFDLEQFDLSWMLKYNKPPKENNYGVSLLKWCEELDSYVFFDFGGNATKEEAQEAIDNSPHGGYLLRYVPTVYQGIRTHKFVRD